MYGKSSYTVESRFLKELGIVDKKKPKIVSTDTFFKPEKEEIFDSGFKIGDVVMHARFGKGEIVDISDDGLVAEINFEDFGKKSLMLNLASLEKVEE